MLVLGSPITLALLASALETPNVKDGEMHLFKVKAEAFLMKVQSFVVEVSDDSDVKHGGLLTFPLELRGEHRRHYRDREAQSTLGRCRFIHIQDCCHSCRHNLEYHDYDLCDRGAD